MKRLLPYSVLLIITIFLGACGRLSAQRSPEYGVGGGGNAPAVEPSAPDYAMPAPTMMVTDGLAEEAPASAPGGNGGGGEAAQTERIVIQNADLVIVVSDVEIRLKEIGTMADDMGGFVVSSNLYQGYTSNYVPMPEASITIRVPAEKLDEALGLIKKDVVEIQSENRSGQDVTKEYVDLKSRLKTYQAAEQELTELMKNAQNTDEVVNIFNQLMYYREQIELVQGQIKYYEEAAALSAVSVRLIAEETIQPVTIGK